MPQHVLLLVMTMAVLVGSSAAPAKNPIGGNLPAVDYRDRTQIFVNMIRQSQPFMRAQDPTARASVDGSGWPTEDFLVQLQAYGTDLVGNYSISCTGKATIVSAGDGVVADSSYDPTTKKQRGTLVITDPAAALIQLRFTGTTGGVTNLTVLIPGFDETKAGDINPLLVHHLRDFSVLRMLSLLPFNRDFITTWAERITEQNSPSWSNFCCPLLRNDSSVPWEAVFQIANTVASADVWVTLPVSADDDYFVQLATLTKRLLSPSINLYIEYGNEMWNGGFPSVAYVKKLAIDSVRTDGDPFHLNYDGVDNEDTWGHRLAGYNAAVRLPALFARVFGGDAVGPGKRIRPIIGGQQSYAGFLADQYAYLDTNYPSALPSMAASTIALYFNMGSSQHTDSLTEQEVLQALNATLATNAVSIRHPFAMMAALNAWYRVPEMVGYESGPDTFGANSLPGKVAANTAAEMGSLVREMYSTWHGYGFSTLNYFHQGACTYDWPYGQWPTRTSMKQTSTPKTLALDAVRTAPRPPPTVGTEVPCPLHNASHFVGFYETPEHPTPPHITFVPVNSSYFYLLRNTQAQPQKMSVLLYTATLSSAMAECVLEVGFGASSVKRTVSTLHLTPTSNNREFVANAAVEITAPPGVSVLRLHVPSVASCSTYNPSNKKTTANFAIGWFEVKN